jgi:acetyltransferase-like isoleucine patch superfamily enzyme
VRYTILDFITPSPLNVYFFKAMGMKVGKGVMINTSNISDPCLIKLEDYVTIGGSAYMMAHYGMKGYLIIDKLVIKRGAMIGLCAKILGGVTIGEKAVVAPNMAVLPKTVIKDGEKYGVPVSSASPNLAEAK